MPTVKLTDRLLRHLKSEKKREFFWDESFPGHFGVRMSDRRKQELPSAISIWWKEEGLHSGSVSGGEFG